MVTRSLTLCPNGKTLYASLCAGGCGGIAYVGVFDQTSNHAYYQPAFTFQNGVGGGQKNIAEASSHEAGHNVGLSHDGTATSGYYSGHGSWAPIMGVGYYRAITQWSKGEYAGANQTQDDFAVMRTNGAGPLADDYPESPPAALGTGLPRTGIISSRTDVDVFRITLTQPTTVTIAATPASTSPDLDIALTPRGFGNDIVVDPRLGIDLGRRRHGIGREHHDRAAVRHLHRADRRSGCGQPARHWVLGLRQHRRLHRVTHDHRQLIRFHRESHGTGWTGDRKTRASRGAPGRRGRCHRGRLCRPGW